MFATDPESRARRVGLLWKYGLLAVAAFIIAPIIFTVVKGLIGLAIAGVVSVAVIAFAPWFSQKMANAALDMRKRDARANPITNRERISLVNWQKLQTRKQQIEAMNAEVRVWADQIATLPPDEQGEFAIDLKNAQNEVHRQALAHAEAQVAQEKFDAVTAKVARKWKVAQTGLRIKALSQKDQEDRINLILADESAESADRALAEAFSSLDAIVEAAQAHRPALANAPSEMIEVRALHVNEPSQVIDVRAIHVNERVRA